MCAMLTCADAGVKEQTVMLLLLGKGPWRGVPANGCAGQASVRSADIAAAMCSSAVRSVK